MKSTVHILLCSLIVSYCYAADDVRHLTLGEKENKEFAAFGFVRPTDTEFQRYHFAAEVTHNVARRLQASYVNDGRNYLISPLSIAVAFGQLLIGAKGPTHSLLRELFIGPTSPSNKTPLMTDAEIHMHLGTAFLSLQQNGSTNGAYQLSAASTFFMQVGLMVKTKFLSDIKKFYASEYAPADFSNDPVNTLIAINKWGSDNTGGLISHILAAPLPPRTAVVLMNAIYFRAPWELPFSAALTKPGHFRINGSHVVEVQQMRGQFDIKYAQNDLFGCRLVVLPYKHKDVKMYVILPNQGVDVSAILTQFTWQQITQFVATATEESVILVMPKMKLTSSISLLEALFKYRPAKQNGTSPNQSDASPNLRAVGTGQKPRTTTQRAQTTTPRSRPVVPVAGPDAVKPLSISGVGKFDLTGASNDQRFQVDDVLHQVSLEVTETGTEAAAVSIGSSYYSGNVKNFKVDRPFVFFIRHEASLVNIFWGIVMDPTNGDYS